MKVWFCGVRGSTPAPGFEFARVGGHTSCVAIGHDDDERPRLVLDAGTGLRRVTELLAGRPFRGTILLSHLHWDHTHGLPFFAAGDREDAEVQVLVPEQGVVAYDLIAAAMSPPHFPIVPAQLRGAWTFDSIDEGTHEIDGFEVLAREIPHKGGRTFGYRVSDGRTSVAYLSDHAPHSLGPGTDGLGVHHEAARALSAGVDVLVHDAQYTAAELPSRSAFGHAAWEYAVGLGAACGVGRVVLFHHDPSRTDDAVDAIVRSSPTPVTPAVEGALLIL